jgi:hypothetical protein
MTTTLNLDKYFSEEDLVTSNEVAFARWINPQKKNPVGLGIDVSEASKANFNPVADDGWHLKTVTVGKGNKEVIDTYVSENPRLILLNPVNAISKNIKGNAKPYFEYIKYKNGLEINSKYCPILFLVVSNNNKIISNPIVLRPKKGCIVQFSKNIIPEWCKAVINVYENLGKKFGTEKPACSFFARHIFEPTFEIADLSNKEGDSSSAWVCNGFKPLDIKNFFSLDSEEAALIQSYIENLPNLLTTVKGVKEEETALQKEINIDDYTDFETGEVNLPDSIPF